MQLCFIENRGLFIEDKNKNLYQIELYRQGSYLNKLIKDGIVVTFDKVEAEISQKISDRDKEIWSVSEVESFIKRSSWIDFYYE